MADGRTRRFGYPVGGVALELHVEPDTQKVVVHGPLDEEDGHQAKPDDDGLALDKAKVVAREKAIATAEQFARALKKGKVERLLEHAALPFVAGTDNTLKDVDAFKKYWESNLASFKGHHLKLKQILRYRDLPADKTADLHQGQLQKDDWLISFETPWQVSFFVRCHFQP
jgi:hypothetical protein